jgi:hypothetical protein
MHDVAKLDGSILRSKAKDLSNTLAVLTEATGGHIQTTKDPLRALEKTHGKELKVIEENFKLVEDKLRQVKEQTIRTFAGSTDKIQTGLKHRLFGIEGFSRDV